MTRTQRRRQRARRTVGQAARMLAVYTAALLGYLSLATLAYAAGAADDLVTVVVLAAVNVWAAATVSWSITCVWATDREQRRNNRALGDDLAAARRELAGERARSATYRADLARARAELAGPAVVAEAEHILRSGR